MADEFTTATMTLSGSSGVEMKAKDTPPIEQMHRRVDNAIQRVHKTIDVLEGRLGAVVAEDPARERVDGSVSSPYAGTSTYARALGEFETALDGATARLERLISRVEI